MGRFIFFTVLILNLACTLKSQTIFVSGSINTNTTWNADSVKIIGDVTVAPGVILSVNPGAFIEAMGYYKIDVLGRIKAIGALNDTIIFTVHDTSSFWQDTTSTNGGWAGINITGTITSSDTSEFKYCSIRFGKKYDSIYQNTNGGVLFVKDYGALLITNSRFTNNMLICDGGAGGAVYCKNVSHVAIDSNIFNNNRSFSYGGAIHTDKQCFHTIISNNLFIQNKAISYRTSGGFLIISGCGAAINNVDDIGLNPIINNNHCYNNTSLNGMIYNNSLHALIYNNVICNNSGSGIVDGHQLSSTKVYNNTIVNNYTELGGIELFSKAKVYNNVCWGNERYPGNVYDQIYVNQYTSNPTLFYNCVQFGEGGDSAINEYPEFVNPSQGVGIAFNGYNADWSLLDMSPCVNRGTPDTTGLFIPVSDVEGNSRIYGKRIEMGAYENQNVWLNTDINLFSLSEIQVYPNPGSNYLIAESGKQICGAMFRMITINGKEVFKTTMTDGKTKVNTSNLKAGPYFWEIFFNDRIIENGKWIKM